MRTEYNNKVVSGVGIVILLLVMWALLTINIGDPWLEHHYGNTTWISAAARNYRLYGAAELGYMVVRNRGPASPDEFSYYTHHPPLIVWFVALAGIPFGQQEATARWVVASATMISISGLYVSARRLFDAKYGLTAAALYGLTPMIAYFGRMPNHEPLALCFLLLFLAIFINWLRRSTFPRWLALAALAVLAVWSAWASVFFIAALGLVALLLGGQRQRRQIIGLGVLTAIATLSIIGFYEWQHPGALDDLISVFAWRTSSAELRPGSESFTLSEFITIQIVHLIPLASLFLLVCGLAGLLLPCSQVAKRIAAQEDKDSVRDAIQPQSALGESHSAFVVRREPQKNCSPRRQRV